MFNGLVFNGLVKFNGLMKFNGLKPWLLRLFDVFWMFLQKFPHKLTKPILGEEDLNVSYVIYHAKVNKELPYEAVAYCNSFKKHDPAQKTHHSIEFVVTIDQSSSYS